MWSLLSFRKRVAEQTNSIPEQTYTLCSRKLIILKGALGHYRDPIPDQETPRNQSSLLWLRHWEAHKLYTWVGTAAILHTMEIAQLKLDPAGSRGLMVQKNVVHTPCQLLWLHLQPPSDWTYSFTGGGVPRFQVSEEINPGVLHRLVGSVCFCELKVDGWHTWTSLRGTLEKQLGENILSGQSYKQYTRSSVLYGRKSDLK